MAEGAISARIRMQGQPGTPVPTAPFTAAPQGGWAGLQAQGYSKTGIDAGWQNMWGIRNRLGDPNHPDYGPNWQRLSPQDRQFHEFWNPITPVKGQPLGPELQGIMGRPQARGEDPNAPFDFNVGPQMASAPLGEGAGPSSPWGGWQPAQEEWT